MEQCPSEAGKQRPPSYTTPRRKKWNLILTEAWFFEWDTWPSMTARTLDTARMSEGSLEGRRWRVCDASLLLSLSIISVFQSNKVNQARFYKRHILYIVPEQTLWRCVVSLACFGILWSIILALGRFGWVNCHVILFFWRLSGWSIRGPSRQEGPGENITTTWPDSVVRCQYFTTPWMIIYVYMSLLDEESIRVNLIGCPSDDGMSAGKRWVGREGETRVCEGLCMCPIRGGYWWETIGYFDSDLVASGCDFSTRSGNPRE